MSEFNGWEVLFLCLISFWLGFRYCLWFFEKLEQHYKELSYQIRRYVESEIQRGNDK